MLDEFGFTVASATRLLAELASRDLALAYTAATPADQTAIEALIPNSPNITEEDIPTSIPANSIQMVPELLAGTEQLAVGPAIGIGQPQQLRIFWRA